MACLGRDKKNKFRINSGNFSLTLRRHYIFCKLDMWQFFFNDARSLSVFPSDLVIIHNVIFP
jgi:hypothetical protein